MTAKNESPPASRGSVVFCLHLLLGGFAGAFAGLVLACLYIAVLPHRSGLGGLYVIEHLAVAAPILALSGSVVGFWLAWRKLHSPRNNTHSGA
jgi:hypothetical protein